MTIQSIDPTDEPALEQMHELHVAAVAREYATPWTWHEFRTAARTPDPWVRVERCIARDEAGVAVAAAALYLPQEDNTHLGYADLCVPRAALGSPCADEAVGWVKDRARRAGRRTLHTEAAWDVDRTTSDDRGFVERHGFTLGIKNAHRVLDLPVDPAAMRALVADAEPHHADYEIQAWRGPCPDEWIETYAELRARMLTEAPSGELELEAEAFGPDRVRHEEAELAAQGRLSCTCVAVAGDGSLAGHTQLIVPGTDPRNAYQWDTLVLAEHRGHRLGLALKVRNMLEAADVLDGRALVHTWNADENRPMVAVNETLGYRLVEYAGEFQCDL